MCAKTSYHLDDKIANVRNSRRMCTVCIKKIPIPMVEALIKVKLVLFDMFK